MLYYCSKCGRQRSRVKGEPEEPCDYCGNELRPIPEEYLGGKNKCYIKDGMEQQFIEEYIKSSPEFDQYLFDHMKEDIYNRQMQVQADIDECMAEYEGRRAGGGRSGITCPYCHGTSVRKVSLAGRAVSAGLFGLASGKIGKQWHCNSCGSDF